MIRVNTSVATDLTQSNTCHRNTVVVLLTLFHQQWIQSPDNGHFLDSQKFANEPEATARILDSQPTLEEAQLACLLTACNDLGSLNGLNLGDARLVLFGIRPVCVHGNVDTARLDKTRTLAAKR